MPLSFKPIFHREVTGHAGPVWHLIGDANDPNVQAEQRQLIAQGCVVVQPAEPVGAGVRQPVEQLQEMGFEAVLIACLGTVWAVITAVVVLGHTRVGSAVLYALSAVPLVLAGFVPAYGGAAAAPLPGSNLKKS